MGSLFSKSRCCAGEKSGSIDSSDEFEMINLTPQYRNNCRFDNNHTYIILGGLGAFGMEFIQWMVERHARKFLVCPQDFLPGLIRERIRYWKRIGIEIEIFPPDIDPASVESILNYANEMGPVGGIFHLGLDVELAIFLSTRTKTISEIIQDQLRSARLFDQKSRYMCPELKHYAIFTAFYNYHGLRQIKIRDYLSKRMDRIVLKREKLGLSGKTIRWGPIVGIRSLTEIMACDDPYSRCSPIWSCLQQLDDILLQPESCTVLMV